MTTDAITDYRQQAREFLTKAWKYLAQGDLHQASENGWEAASQMVKAVAQAHGVSYETHDEFGVVMDDACDWLDSDRPRILSAMAQRLYDNHYRRKIHLRASEIELDLHDMEELLEILTPLANG